MMNFVVNKTELLKFEGSH